MLRYLAIFFGPIFAKEMVEVSRRRRYYALRVLYGAVLFLTLFSVYENHWFAVNTGAMSIQAMARMAHDTYEAVSGVQLAAVLLFVPVFLAGVIASEREEQTLDLLFTTQLVNREIVLGKLFSRLVVLIFLIMCSLPFMSLIMFFGGIDPDALWRMQAATILAMLYAGSTAIYYSTVTRSPMGALVRTYWQMVLWLLGMPAIIWLVCFLVIIKTTGMGPMGPPQWVLYTIGAVPFVNPIGAYIVGGVPELYNTYANRVGSWFYPAVLILPALWSLLLIWRAVRVLRVAPKPVRSFVEKLRWVRSTREAWEKGARLAHAHRRFMPDRAWFLVTVRNPYWLRSRRAPVYDREGHVRRMQTACWLLAAFFILMIVSIEPRSVTHSECAMVFLSVTWIAIVGFTAIIAGTGLVGDRRRGFLELVLMTPMTAREIINGGVLTIWQHMQRLYWLPCFLCLFFLVTEAAWLPGVIWSLVIATLFLLLLIHHGTACSLSARSMPPALTLTLLFPVLTVAIVPFIGALFREACGPALGVLSVVALVVTRRIVRRKSGAAAVGSYLLAVHLTLVLLATCWTWFEGRHGKPILAIHPGAMTIIALDRDAKIHGEFHELEAMQICYVAALAVNLVYLRRWLIRNFDRLADRCGDRPQPPINRPQPAPEATPALVAEPQAQLERLSAEAF
jgi:ABC-type transport system involved in multi-copper enzyme maturation permease subunit